MAAGLPVVVSDWDGYRFTVAHGESGFLIPTLGAVAPQLGTLLANLHLLSLETYQTYVGAVAQHTAVDIGEAASALLRLFTSPLLRAQMGACGQAQAMSRFSWPVVVRQYNQLFDRLTERRLRAAMASPQQKVRSVNHPFRGDPFADFKFFPTDQIGPAASLERIEPFDAQALITRLQSVELDRMFAGIRADLSELQRLLLMFEASPRHSLHSLLAVFAPERAEYITLTLVWLCKVGVLRWR